MAVAARRSQAAQVAPPIVGRTTLSSKRLSVVSTSSGGQSSNSSRDGTSRSKADRRSKLRSDSSESIGHASVGSGDSNNARNDTSSRVKKKSSDAAKEKQRPPESGKDPKDRARRAAAEADMSNEEEEAMFLRVLDFIERQDEFNSITSSSDSSVIGDDEDEVSSIISMSSEMSDDSDTPGEKGELSDWELEAAHAELRQRQMPKMAICTKILRRAAAMLNREKNVVRIRGPEPGARLVVVGDLHGHFADLVHILDEHGDPDPASVRYIFNGDFVDRGTWGPEVLLLLYVLKARFPDAVYLSRGNHEDEQQNNKADNGFVHMHCTRAWGAEATRMYRLCRKSFHALPLAHVVANEVIVLHGGLPLDSHVTLDDIDAIDRRRDVPVRLTKFLNYPMHQRVRAKRVLISDDGEEVQPGRAGRIVELLGGGQALVEFKAGGSCDEVAVKLFGAPDLEDDVSIEYDSTKEKDFHRQNRLFVALMWSDPCHTPGDAGPSKRGAGSTFDDRITNEFLRVNKLRLMLRSHEKRKDGFCEEHRVSNRLLCGTIFSASNYPTGAGEPNGNHAAVVVLTAPKDGQYLSETLNGRGRWREAYTTDDAFAEVGLSSALKQSIREAEQSQGARGNVRVRALSKLKELIYCNRPKLLSYWQRIDARGTGQVSKADFSCAMRSCVIPDDDFPWEHLVPYLMKMLEPKKWHGKFNYAVFLSQYENSLEKSLASHWHSTMMRGMLDGSKSVENTAREAWDKIDRNGDGRLSYQELKPILKQSNNGPRRHRLEDEDRVYSLLTRMDGDKTGFVDREEFIQVMKAATEASEDKFSGKWSAEEISQVWAATQAAIRALSGTTGCAASVFQALDSDGDGAIDRMEFIAGLKQLLSGSPLLKSMSHWEPLLWKLVDEDGSGLVSPEELNFAFSVREVLSI